MNNIHETVPRPIFNPPNQKLQEKTLKERGISIEGRNITMLDWFSIHPEILRNKDLLLQKISEVIGTSLESKESFEKINRYFENAINFIENFIGRKIPDVLKKIKINSKQDLMDFFGQMQSAQKRESGRRLSLLPYYCAIAKVALAYAECDKNEMKGFAGEDVYLYETLLDNQFFVQKHRVSRISKQGRPFGNEVLMSVNNASVDGIVNYRTKSLDSIIAKMLFKPETDARKIITDGIGMRIYVPRNNVFDVLKAIVSKMNSLFAIDKTAWSFQNLSQFSREIETLRRQEANIDTTTNTASIDSFTVARVVITAKIPESGKKDAMIVERNIEIQVVPLENKNEYGLSGSPVYKVKQKLSIHSRIFGPFGERYLGSIAQKAAQDTGQKVENIKNYLLKSLFKITMHGKRGVWYCSKEHVERWKKTGVFSEELVTS